MYNSLVKKGHRNPFYEVLYLYKNKIVAVNRYPPRINIYHQKQDTRMTYKFRLTTIAAAVIAGISFSNVQAQEADVSISQDTAQSSENDLQTEVIEVTGFRSSLADSLFTKKNANNIVDAIAAEDIGKSTDQNIAEALQRVTGISINRADGEGTTIVARGAPADLNNITINGVPVTSGGVNQGVNLNNFSADVLQAIEVYKTASADLDEGSLGATINLKTFKPLNSKENKRSFAIQSRYNPFVDGEDFELDKAFSQDYKFNAAWSEKLLDDTLGLAVVVTQETQTSRKDEWSNNRFSSANGSFGVTNSETGEVITEFDFGDGNGLQPIRGLINNNIFYDTNLLETERFNLTGTIQYKPTDSTDIQFDVTYSTRDDDRRINRLQITPDRNNRAAAQGNPQNLVFDPTSLMFIRSLQTAIVDGPNNQNRESDIAFSQASSVTEAETLVLSSEIIHQLEDFTFTVRGGHSKSVSDTPFNYFARFNNRRPRRTGRTIGFDCVNSSPELCYIVAPEDYVSDPTNFLIQTSSRTEQDVSDEASSLYFDVDWEKEFGPIANIEAGLKWTSRTKSVERRFARFNSGDAVNELRGGLTLQDFSESELSLPFGQEFGLPADAVGTNGFFVVDGQEVFNAVTAAIGEEPTGQIDIRNTREIKNEVFGGYIKANLDMMEGKLLGDVGLRIVRTEVDSVGFSGFDYANADFIENNLIDFFNGDEAAAVATLGRNTLADPSDVRVTGENSYTNVLPSLNLNYIASEQVIARFAASQTIARPRIDDLKPGFLIQEQQFRTNSSGVIGNPTLDPYKSTNLDLSVEWYFDENSLLSVALFNKDLKDIAERSFLTSYWADVRSEFYSTDGNLLPEGTNDYTASLNDILLPLSGGANQAGCMPNRELDLEAPSGEPGCDLLILNQTQNAASGYVRGLELSLQHNFTNLPGIWSGLGFVANYTYSDSRQDEELNDDGSVFLPKSPLVETSEHTANATVFYENADLLLRLAYNTRTDYIAQRVTPGGNTLWVEGFDTVDVSASYNVNKNVSINFQGQNITDTVQRSYVTAGGAQSTAPVPAEPIDFGAYSGRTARLQNTGPIYRVGVRVTF